MGIWDFIQDEILGMKWLNRLIGSMLNACGLDTSEKIGGSVQFFIYDVIKIMVLLGVLIFLISYIQIYFPPERTKKILGRFHGIGANCIAALLGEHESAIQDYTEAVRINPKNTNAYYNRGNSYRSLGRYQNAAEDYTAVLRIDRYKIRNEHILDAVFDFLCSNIGSYVNANKIANTLKSNGYKEITDDTVGNYLEYLCDSFLFYKVQRYDIRGKHYLKTQNKYYISDLGVRNAKLKFRQIEVTHSLENIIYLELIKQGFIVDIGKNDNREIDFVVRSLDGNQWYIQVAYTLQGEEKLQQETASLKNIKDGYRRIILTMDDDPFENLEGGIKKSMCSIFCWAKNPWVQYRNKRKVK